MFEEGQGVEVSSAERAPEVFYVQVDGTAVNGRGAGEWMDARIGWKPVVKLGFYRIHKNNLNF